MTPVRIITLATLATATPQAVFDQAARHMLTQGKQSTEYRNGVTNCLYRADGRADGTIACAAGCFVAPNKYDPNMEHNRWHVVAFEAGVTSHVELIERLQNIHDDERPDDWADNLRELANADGLSSAVVDEFDPIA